MNNKTDIKTNIYPVPNFANPFLGVHYTITSDGSIKIGPTAIPAFWRENYRGFDNFNLKEMIEILYYESKLFILNAFNFRKLAIEEMKNYSSKVFIQKAKDMVKSIENDFKPISAGIRAQLLNKKTNELVQDFILEHNKNSTHILNVVSPAFTCSFAFAKYVVDEIKKKQGETFMKKILVTGSEGYIGSVLVPLLIDNGFEIVGLDTCFYQEGNLNEATYKNYELIKKDIRDLKKEDFKDYNFYGIVHLAALSNDPLGMLDEQLTYDINHLASVNLAKIAKDLKIERFVFASSCSLYGQGGSKALTENSPSNPQTAYGKSKILAENDISQLADDKFSPTFMRNATAFGFSPRMRFDIVVNNLSGFAKVEKEIKILGDGKPWRPLVHVKDICKSILVVLNAEKNVIHNQAYNVGSSSENYQILSIAEHCQKFFPECKISISQNDSGDTRNYNVSFNKISEQLNYKIDFDLNKGIEDLKNIYDEIDLNEQFTHRYYTRLKQINHLIENKLIDTNLRWQ